MGTPKRSVEERREEVVQTMLALLQEQGQRGLTVSAVARRIGLVPSAIYRHFRNRDAMVEGVVEYIASRLRDNVTSSGSGLGSSEVRLRRLLDRHVALIRSNPGMLRIVFSEELFGGTPQRRALLNKLIQGYLDSVAEIVSEGQAAGEFSRSPTPEDAAVYFLGLIQPLAVMWHLSDGGVDITRLADRNWKLFRAALACEPGSGKKGTKR